MLSALPTSSRCRKSRPAASFCRERFACTRVNALATYECEECGTEQCGTCERLLHEDRKYAAHSRRKLREVSPERLCEAKTPCEPRNFADVVCVDCGNCRLCFDCDRKAHSAAPSSSRARPAKLSSHRREPFILPSQRTLPGLPATSSAGSTEPPALLSSPVKTLSPLSGEDDSLTFFSLPQSESERPVTNMSDRIQSVSKSPSTSTGDPKHKTGKPDSGKSEKEEVGHGRIPDVAAMLPLSSNSELRNVEFDVDDDYADDIAESLQRSRQEGRDNVQSFTLVDHNEELQV